MTLITSSKVPASDAKSKRALGGVRRQSLPACLPGVWVDGFWAPPRSLVLGASVSYLEGGMALMGPLPGGCIALQS